MSRAAPKIGNFLNIVKTNLQTKRIRTLKDACKKLAKYNSTIIALGPFSANNNLSKTQARYYDTLFWALLLSFA
jgi:hypothetical protein